MKYIHGKINYPCEGVANQEHNSLKSNRNSTTEVEKQSTTHYLSLRGDSTKNNIKRLNCYYMAQMCAYE